MVSGIGTFVKAQNESHVEVGDRTNDSIRINANQLRCKIVAEGGNLGFTQLGRIEYSLNGGLIYTDFIDNSAGVSCSDKEVNIKILLDGVVKEGDLTFKQRNELLSEMTKDVEELVLRENFLQTRAISLLVTQSLRSIELHSRYINELERTGKIDRSLEYLPNEKSLMENKLLGKGLSSPSMCVLLCHSKINLKEAILATDVPEDPHCKPFLKGAFPRVLQTRYKKELQEHPLRREIIATKLSNIIINEMGFSFIYRLKDETGAPDSAVVRAYMIARSIFDMESIWHQIDELENKIKVTDLTDISMLYIRLLRRLTRWFLRTQRMRLNIAHAVKLYTPGMQELKKSMPNVFGEVQKTKYKKFVEDYVQMGIPSELAHELTISRALFAAMDILEVAQNHQANIAKVAEIYFHIGEYLELSWIRQKVITNATDNHWEALSREALRDDLDWQQRQLTAGIISYNKEATNFMDNFNKWIENNTSLIARWRNVLTNLQSSSASLTYTMFFVAIRELLDLTQTTMQQASDSHQLMQEA